MHPEQLSRELRTADDPSLRRRRAIVGLSFFAAGAMGAVGLYQMGLIRRLPDPPIPGFDAEKVDASAEAYSMLSMPDGFLGIGSYAATAALAAMGGADRAHRRPWIPLALLVKVLMDAGQAAKLTRDQIVEHRALCSWCLAAAGATFAAIPLAAPEAVAAVRT